MIFLEARLIFRFLTLDETYPSLSFLGEWFMSSRPLPWVLFLMGDNF